MKTKSSMVTILLAGQLSSLLAFAGPTKVGNGDDGMDLEGAAPVTSGPIIESRKKAVAAIQRLNVSGVRGMGTLIQEIETSPAYVAQKDANASLNEDHGAFHSDLRGLVYARTFANPHSPTRFFPAALKLSEEQLIALHIHEGLHRSLPESVREQESTVASLTLALTAPMTSFDQVARTADRLIPEEKIAVSTVRAIGTESSVATANPIPEDARIRNPSLIGYSYKMFAKPKSESLYPVSQMHVLQSFLYPFGSDGSAFGLGIEAALIGSPEKTQSGPLSISARLRVWSGRGFDVGVWGVSSFNMLSAEELKNSPLGRDVTTLGISMRKDMKHLYVENFLSWSMKGQSKERIGLIDYTYSYGDIVTVSTHAGTAISKFKLGGFAEINLADYFKFGGGAFSPQDTGRFRILSAGPEVSWQDRDFSVTLAGRFLLDSTKDASFDTLGNIMGQGVAQGNMSANVSFFF